MKKSIIIVLTVVVVVALGYATYNFIIPTGLKECPDEKIVDNMPRSSRSSRSSYYIKDGARKEISAYNNAWVKSNCSVPVQNVY
jgi:hypothetical protein